MIAYAHWLTWQISWGYDDAAQICQNFICYLLLADWCHVIDKSLHKFSPFPHQNNKRFLQVNVFASDDNRREHIKQQPHLHQIFIRVESFPESTLQQGSEACCDHHQHPECPTRPMRWTPEGRASMCVHVSASSATCIYRFSFKGFGNSRSWQAGSKVKPGGVRWEIMRAPARSRDAGLQDDRAMRCKPCCCLIANQPLTQGCREHGSGSLFSRIC